MKDIDFTVVGYPSIDRIIKTDTSPRIGKTSTIINSDNNAPYFGGCSVNIACLSGKLGLNTALLMNVGNDFESTGFKKFIENSNVLTEGISIKKQDVTTCSYLISNPEGNHITLFYPGAMNSDYKIDLDENIIKRSKYGIITVGNIKCNREFAYLCKKNDVPIVFGMKCDFKSFNEDVIKEIISCCEIITMNENEKLELEKLLKIKDITDIFNNKITKIIIVTKGNKGSEIHEFKNKGKKRYFIPIAKPKLIVDTAGVGDAYLSGFMIAYMKGKEIEKCGRLGAVMASFIIEKMGCLTNIPTIEELKIRYMENYKEEF